MQISSFSNRFALPKTPQPTAPKFSGLFGKDKGTSSQAGDKVTFSDSGQPQLTQAALQQQQADADKAAADRDKAEKAQAKADAKAAKKKK